jgi:adenylate cyclase
MKFREFAEGYRTVAGAPLVERSLRLTTGLILFAYATCHFLNHAFGIRSVAAMQAASHVLLDPWQTYPGLVTLYSALLIHGALGLAALNRRRHLRIPRAEVWQLATGLAIPLLLIPHAAGVRLGTSLANVEVGYARLLYHFWVVSPEFALPRQTLLLLVLWVHGCIGLRAWLRTKPWYGRFLPALTALATLIPVLAFLGFANAGLDIREAVQRDPAFAARLAAPTGHDGLLPLASVQRIVDGLSIAYLLLVGGVLALREIRLWYARRFRAVHITYPGRRVVAVPAGFSVLEASRWAGIPHASVCGGRGRCSTCRVRVVQGAGSLTPPSPIERRTLSRIKAPADIRLACQIRPVADIAVDPLVSMSREGVAEALRFDAAVEGGLELEIVAVSIDLRESTRLASGRLPYDVLFLFDRYIQAVTQAIRHNGGHVTSIAGDGVMSVFGAGASGDNPARAAFQAALDAWTALDTLNDELLAELGAPLRIGIGLHVGLAVVGWIADHQSRSLQFLGDTGNIAAKLEAQTKELGCTLVASIAALNAAKFSARHSASVLVELPGREAPLEVVTFQAQQELRRFLD